MNGGCLLKGRWFGTVRDPDGTIVRTFWCDNGVTTGGLNDVLSVYFRGGAQSLAWYAGLIDNAGFSALAASDTAASHPGWNENTGYQESTRPTWVPNAPSNGIMAGAAITFTAQGSQTIRGAFLASVNSKGATTGLLYSTGQFGTPQTLVNGQTLTLSYQAAQAAAAG